MLVNKVRKGVERVSSRFTILRIHDAEEKLPKPLSITIACDTTSHHGVIIFDHRDAFQIPESCWATAAFADQASQAVQVDLKASSSIVTAVGCSNIWIARPSELCHAILEHKSADVYLRRTYKTLTELPVDTTDRPLMQCPAQNTDECVRQ